MPSLPSPVTRWRPRLSGSGPRYLALVDAIAEGVADGTLHRGERLPTQRRLAAMLRLNLATVTRAIAEAERRGLVQAQQGRGTFIADDPDAVTSGGHDLTLNLPVEPPGSPLPRQLQETTASLLRGAGAERLLRYPELGGGALDRAAGARWLARRGLQVDASQVVLTDGADHALLLALVALARIQGRILVESLSYPGVRTMAAMLGVPIQGVVRDDDGVVPADLDRELRRGPALLVLTPTCHNPTTRTMSLARREAIARLLARRDLLLVEDDVYGYHPEDGPPPIAALAPDRCAYLTSFSKVFAPGLRIGYLASAGDAIAERLGAAARATTSTPAALAAAVASRWVDGGEAEAALHAARRELARRDELCARLLPDGVVGHGTTCPHRWLELSAGWTRQEFVERARQHGVLVRASDAFAVDLAPPEAVRFSISAPRDLAALECALLTLARTVREPHGLRRAVV